MNNFTSSNINMAKKNTTKFDTLVETINKAITDVKNYNLVLECPDSTFTITFFVKYILELNNFFTLYKYSFIPAANKASFESKNDYLKSLHKNIISIKESDFKESIYETVRLGYVGLNHKYESFSKGIKTNVPRFNKAYDIEEEFSIIDFITKEFGKDILFPLNVKEINKVRIIANAVKHNDGVPQKPNKETDDILLYYPIAKEGEKLCIDPNHFLIDIQNTINYILHVNTIIQYSYIYYSFISNSDYSDLPEWDEKLQLFKKTIQDLVDIYEAN